MILSMIIFAAFALAAVLAHHLHSNAERPPVATAHRSDPAPPVRPTGHLDDDRPELAWTALDDQQLDRLLRGAS